MTRISLRLFIAAVAASLLSGCNAANMSSSTSTTYASVDLTGNWQFTPIDAFFGPYPLIAFTGALAGQGNEITGTFYGGALVFRPPRTSTSLAAKMQTGTWS